MKLSLNPNILATLGQGCSYYSHSADEEGAQEDRNPPRIQSVNDADYD